MQVGFVVILHVVAHCGEVDDDRDVQFGKLRAWADTAELEDLRRVECASGDDDLLPCVGGFDGFGLLRCIVTAISRVESRVKCRQYTR